MIDWGYHVDTHRFNALFNHHFVFDPIHVLYPSLFRMCKKREWSGHFQLSPIFPVSSSYFRGLFNPDIGWVYSKGRWKALRNPKTLQSTRFVLLFMQVIFRPHIPSFLSRFKLKKAWIVPNQHRYHLRLNLWNRPRPFMKNDGNPMAYFLNLTILSGIIEWGISNLPSFSGYDGLSKGSCRAVNQQDLAVFMNGRA